MKGRATSASRATSALRGFSAFSGFSAFTAIAAMCACTANRPPPAPITNASAARLPPASVTCFDGVYTEYDGERVRVLMRRALDPAARLVRQEAVRASGGFGFVTDGVVVLSVSGGRYTSKSETARGEGTFEGPDWNWTGWTETRRHGEAPHEIVETLFGSLEGSRLKLNGSFLESGHTWSAELDAFACADYQSRLDQMTAAEEALRE